MRRRGPAEEACGVWLDAAALKRRKVQTHLIKPSTKILTLLPEERKTNIYLTQRRTPHACVKQTSIASFFTLQPGKTNGGDQRSVPSPAERQINKESKNDASPLRGHLIQGSGDGCMALPFATSTPADIPETGFSPQLLQTSGHHKMGNSLLTELSLLQPDTLVCAGQSEASLAFSFTQDLGSSCLLDQKEGQKDSSIREWLHGSKKKSQGLEGHSSPARRKCPQSLDKAKLERKVSAKENREVPRTHRESWNGKNIAVERSPCPVSVFSWDSEKNDKDSWNQLFTEDSQGQQVIAHNSRAPFQNISNSCHQGLAQFPDSTQALCQVGPTQFHLPPDLLFTQDSEVQALACLPDCYRFLAETQKHLSVVRKAAVEGVPGA
ncbi:aurora kinase A- and ninein-interacting protein [Lepus europaeus]|uniref:aurora kinase A- and ninein-interacting protein n=1 Tax=Lepus europaeus TaxID=9983 RepID=UPI002B49A865|nr:aurora kinase A- and ninein-interacting protein [Lepus europaeus]